MRKLLETITRFVLHFTGAFLVFEEVISQLSQTHVKRSRETLNKIEQGISTSEMRRELTRALIGQSAHAHSAGRPHWNPHQYQTWWLCRMIGGVTIEINSPNGQEIHWIREMLRQDMVVGQHATATYIEVVVQ